MSRYSSYLQSAFELSPDEASTIIDAMLKPIKKSIRVNTRKIDLEAFQQHAHDQWWTLTPTEVPEVFYIDRDDTSIALGNTLEHQAGWFYVQEVAAAFPPHLLRKSSIKDNTIMDDTIGEIDARKSDYRIIGLSDYPGIILDMCSSPGGKTTQLATYFPESLIIANEINRARTPQLFDNLERMGYDNVAVISCDGRFLQNFPSFFDTVLLDAPCSGEGTAFRDAGILRNWHEKNIHRLAKLQKQLLETAWNIVKPGWLVSYSTCTLNKEENEGVLASMQNTKDKGQNQKTQNTEHKTQRNGLIENWKLKNWDIDWKLKIENWKLETSRVQQSITEHFSTNIKRLFSHRFWPHLDHTGGFFVSLMRKTMNDKRWTINSEPYPLLSASDKLHLVKKATKGEWEIVERFVAKHLGTTVKDGFLYTLKNGVYICSHNLQPLEQYFYFVHAGARIGTIEGNAFEPSLHLYWHLADTTHVAIHQLSSEEMHQLAIHKKTALEWPDGYLALSLWRGILGIVKRKSGEIRMG